jgi:hypothetical protein
MTSLGANEADRKCFDQGLVERFVTVDDHLYADIRSMLREVEAAGLSLQ